MLLIVQCNNTVLNPCVCIQLYIFTDFIYGDFVNSTSSPSIPALLRNEEEIFGQKDVDTKKRSTQGAEVIDACNTIPTMSTSGLTWYRVNACL